MESLGTLIRTFPHAVGGAFVIAATCSLLGVFVILKRMVFVGVTLSQVAACGVALGIALGVQPYLGAGILTLATVLLLAYPYESARLPRDGVLGIIFVVASAVSILVVSQSGFGLHEVQGMLYGDLIFMTPVDLIVICSVLIPVLIYLVVFLRPTLNTFLDREASRVLGIRTSVWELLFFAALGLSVSVASRTAGLLLVFCYLVVPSAGAMLLSRRLVWVLMASVLIAVLATGAGLLMSVQYDLPTNHTVAATACGLFLVAAAGRGIKGLVQRVGAG